MGTPPNRCRSTTARVCVAAATIVVSVATLAPAPVFAVGATDGSKYWMRPSGANSLRESTRDLLVDGSTIFFSAGDIGGAGTLPNDSNFHGVGSFDGTTWSSLADSITANGSCNTYNGRPSVHSLAGTADDLYVAGEFTAIDGTAASLIARRRVVDGVATWSALGDGLCYGASGGYDYHDVHVFVDGSDVYATGTFRKANGSSTWVQGVAKWDGSTWSSLGGWDG